MNRKKEGNITAVNRVPIEDIFTPRSEKIYLENDTIRATFFYVTIILIFLLALNERLVDQLVVVFLIFLAAVPVIKYQLIKTFQNLNDNPKWITLITVIDSFCVGMSIGLIKFSIIPTLVFLGLLCISLIYVRRMLAWVMGIFFVFVGVVSASYIMDYHGMSLQRTPVELSVVSLMALIGFYIYESYQKNKVIDSYDAELLTTQQMTLRQIHITNRVAKYAPIQVWQPIVNGSEVRIENKRKKMTVFFSDISGFTETSERLAPDDLAMFLNTYFEEMTEIAHKFGGTVDKFMGDGLLIFFGDTQSEGSETDAIKCIDMGIAMRRRIQALSKQEHLVGFNDINVRMAISSGYCHVGNFGSPARMSYTIIGPDVNLAARLQQECEPNEILVSDNTYKLVRKAFIGNKREGLVLKGIREPVVAWSIVDRFENMNEMRKNWIEFSANGFYLQLDMNALSGADRARVIMALKETTVLIDRRNTN